MMNLLRTSLAIAMAGTLTLPASTLAQHTAEHDKTTHSHASHGKTPHDHAGKAAVAAGAASAGAGAAAAGEASSAASAVQPKAQPVWIDVRSEREYKDGHLPGAHNVEFDVIGKQIEALVPDRNTPVMLYCRSGRRAETARQTLLKMGYTQVENRGAYKDVMKSQGGEQQATQGSKP